MVCSKCGSAETREARRLEFSDLVERVAGRSAYRCRKCGIRFYGALDPRRTFVARMRRKWRSRRERERAMKSIKSSGGQVLLYGFGFAIFLALLWRLLAERSDE